MAPKQAELINNPPLASSSEEDEEESGSSAEESDSSGEDSKKDDSSDDEPPKQTQKPAAPVALKKPESDSEGESDSDSDPEPSKKKKERQIVLLTKPRSEGSGSAVNLPESSNAKRPLKQGGEEDESKKKMKTEEVKKISGEEAKKMFQRLFSESDEIALLQGILDFTGEISEDMDSFCNYAKKLINFDATRSQIVTKIQRLKKKFVNIVKKSLKKGKGEDQIKFAKDLDQKAFDLSRKIWGNDGLLASRSRKKIGGGNPKEIKIKLAHSPQPHPQPKKLEAKPINVVNDEISSSREIALFFTTGTRNSNVFGLDESTLSAGWDMVADGPKKREMEEKLKKLKTKQVELCLQRSSLANVVAKMIFEDNASSSS